MCLRKMTLLVSLFAMSSVLLDRTKVLSFNIEDRSPIVKRHDAGSYFGFSVAQHAVNESSLQDNNYWILVGAPLGKNLQPGTNHSGALFKCPVNTERQNDCEQVVTDGKRLDNFDYEDFSPNLRQVQPLQPPGNDEIKDNQWLGVTVKSQKPGGKVVVCAHRYIQSYNLDLYHYGMGLCYLLSNDLETEEDLQPCKGRPMDKLHQQFGFCQVGTSLAVLDDGFALMGSPGPYTWRGTIFAKDVVGEFLDKDKTIYKGPLNDNPFPIDKYSYLGMSTTGGYFFNKSLMTYVSGAPRANFTGQVYFFDKTKSVEEMGIRLIISGEQFAASFGYEILAVDIDQDGYDELLVGSPFFYGHEVGGAVYIYENLRNCSKDNCQATAVLKGKLESRFGFSMTSLGDINKDGFTDVAIGAPYESGGGAIYIYLGSKQGLNPTPSQVIKHPNKLKTLGYSLSGGLDMDSNEYPDLLVGAYDSDLAILYKTRPIIDITIDVRGDELKNINVTKRGCNYDKNTNKTCFSFDSCFTISKFKISEPLDVRYEIKELPKKIPRVTFNDTRKVRFISVDKVQKTYCQTETVYLAEGNGDILTPIKFMVNYSLYNNRVNSPILNKTSLKEFEATFQKNCGDDDVCDSHLVLTAGTQLNQSEDGYILNLGENKEFILEANVTNHGESAYEAKLFITHPDALSYVALLTDKNKTSNVVCTSPNETSIVTCNLGNPFQENQTANLRLRFEIKDTKQQKLDLKIFVNSTSHETSNQTSQSLVAILQKTAFYLIKGQGKPPNIFYSGRVRGQSDMDYLDDIGPKVVHSYEIINQGQWNIRDVVVKIKWPYQVYSDRKEGGKWLLYLEKAPIIDLPVNNFCSVDPPEAINPLNLNSSGLDEGIDLDNDNGTQFVDRNIRRRRDVEYVVPAETRLGPDGKQRKIVTMDCDRKTAKCAVITCAIAQLNQNSQIKIQIFARVWNSTLVEDYSQVDWVSIKSIGHVIIDGKTIIHSNDSVAATAIDTTAYPSVVLADTSLNIWIIVGSVLAGLILLVILIFILYKCGFFKRNRIKDHTLSGNLKKQGESETLLKDNEGKSAKSAL